MRKYFIAGLLVWLPILATLVIFKFIISMLDQSIALLPVTYRPEAWLGTAIPGFGVVVSLLLLFSTGAIATNFFGRRFVEAWERLIGRIPMVRTIHAGFKQVSEAIFSPSTMAFSQVLLVEYPRQGLWSIAFQTGAGSEEISQQLGGESLITIFIPTTPNPTSGFLMLVPKKDAIELTMTVEQALKFVVSLGVIQPSQVSQLTSAVE